jgi:hypothetical protein
MRELLTALAVVTAACTAACGGPDVPSEGRGSATCHEWQDSVCDWADRCSALERADCDAQFQAVTCKSDMSASKCAEDFDRAGCGAAAARCGLAEIADPAPATRACDTLMNRFCERVVACGVRESLGDCVTNVMENVDCSLSVAYTLEYEDCLALVNEMQCDVLVLPEVCDNVIISRPRPIASDQ